MFRALQVGLKSPSLFTGYLTQNNQQQWQLISSIDKQGWFTSEDSLQINKHQKIQGIERINSIVKILGEKVSLKKQLEQLHQAIIQVELPSKHVIITTRTDLRKGVSLVPNWENKHQLDISELQKKLDLASHIYHANQESRLTELEPWKIVKQFKRTALGKISN